LRDPYKKITKFVPFLLYIRISPYITFLFKPNHLLRSKIKKSLTAANAVPVWVDHIKKAQIMGLATRIFIVKEGDSLQCLSQKRYNRLTKGHPDKGLMQFAGKRIRYALFVQEMINRKPVKILMTEYSFLFFDSEGRLDKNEREKAAQLVMDTLTPIVPAQKSGKVIDVKHRFAKKRYDERYQWKPSPEIETAIQRAIFG